MKLITLKWLFLTALAYLAAENNAEETDDGPTEAITNGVDESSVQRSDDKNHEERSINYAFTHSQSSSGGSIHQMSVGGHHRQQLNRVRACNVVLWQGEGNLTSYNYPFNYPDAIECSYRIRRVDFSSCALELTFHDFNLDTDGSQCNSDFLQVGSKRFCGRLDQGTKEIVNFPYRESELTLTFTSDDVESGRGFWIEVRRLYRCNEGITVPAPSDLNVRTVQGRITSYAYPENYRENMNCTYFIERQPGFCSVKLEFVDFDIGDSPGCYRDHMTVEGIRYCGNTLYGRKLSVEFQGRSDIVLVFVADDRGGNRGFDVRYNQVECPREIPTGRVIDPNLPPPQSAASCNREFSSREMYLQSHNYPSFYESNLDCVYTIRRSSNDVCELEFMFLNFDVEYDRLCRGDYLEVNGGKICGPLPNGSSRRVRFYGSEMVLKFHSDDTVNRPGFDIRISQKADCSTSGSTRIIATQSYCDEELNSQEFYLQSANYPNYYSNYMDCAYVIRKFSNQVCDLQLTFLSFDLQDDHSCSYDYLEIDGKKICGNIPHGSIRRITFDKPEILVRFHSDRASSGRGFQIFAQQRRDCARGYAIQLQTPIIPTPRLIPSPPFCDETFNSEEFRVRSLHYPSNYEDNMSCTLRIVRTSSRVCELELVFNAFDVEDDAGCRYDYLEVGGQRHCGFIGQGTVRRISFVGPEVILRFRSDHTNNRPGFDVTLRQLYNCLEEIPIQLPRIIPPQTTYTKGGAVSIQQVATYTKGTPYIQPTYTKGVVPPLVYDSKGTQTIQRTVYGKGSSVVVPPTQTIYTKESVVVPPVYLKGTQPIPRIPAPITYTKGVEIVPQPMPAPVAVVPVPTYDKGGSQQVHVGRVRQYTKGSSNIVPLAAYNTGRIVPSARFTYETSVPSTGCDLVFTTWEFFFQSVNFPMEYGNDVDCTYRAQRFSLAVCEIELHFMSFDVEGTDACTKDYLEVDGERFCGAIAPGTIRRYTFDGPEFVLRFHSDHETSGLGFNVLVRQKTQCPSTPLAPAQLIVKDVQNVVVQRPALTTFANVVPLYDFELSQPSSQFASLNYPGDYGHGINCTYRIARTKDVCAVELYFYEFNVQQSPDCVSDYLLFGGRRYCGNELQGQTRMLYFEHSSEAVLNFVSDGEISGKGWWAFYRQVPCAEVKNDKAAVTSELCGQTFSEEIGFIKSRNYPLSQYPSDEDCFYRIKRVRDEICALELSFTDFSLEPSTDCVNDYLEMDRRRYCGNDLLRKTVYLNFPVGSDDILLHFKSNDNREDNGFFLQARQLSYGCRTSSNLPAVSSLYHVESNSCSRVLRSESDVIESPNYPSAYSANSDCTFTVEKSHEAVCGLQLEFDHFSVETSRLCLYDYLQISIGDRLCGNSWTGVKRTVPFPAHEDRLTFIFHSDERIQDRGFCVRYRQITTGCP